MQKSFNDHRPATQERFSSHADSSKGTEQDTYPGQSVGEKGAHSAIAPRLGAIATDSRVIGAEGSDPFHEPKTVDHAPVIAALTATVNQLKINSARTDRKMVVRHEEIASLVKLVLEYEQRFDSTLLALTSISKKLGLEPLLASTPIKSSKIDVQLSSLDGAIDRIQSHNEQLSRQLSPSREQATDRHKTSQHAISTLLPARPDKRQSSGDEGAIQPVDSDANWIRLSKEAKLLREENIFQEAEVLRLQSLVSELENRATTARVEAVEPPNDRVRHLYSPETAALQAQLLDKIQSLESSLAQRFEEVAILTSRLVTEGEQVEDPFSKLDSETRQTRVNQHQDDSDSPLRTITKIFAKRRKKSHFKKQERALRQSGLFDSEWYLNEYPDVRAAGVDPLIHYLQFGADELRNPNPEFNTGDFVQSNPSLIKDGLNPFFLYLTIKK